MIELILEEENMINFKVIMYLNLIEILDRQKSKTKDR